MRTPAGSKVPEDGLSFPPCGVDHLAEVLKGRANGGQLAEDGMVEVVSSLERDGRPVFRDLRWGVYVVFKAPNDYAAACFKQYGMTTDRSGRYAALYRPYHLIGLELSISVLNAVLNRQPTGATRVMARRRGGGRQARPQGRRDARRRGRLYRLRQADSGRAELARTRCRSASLMASRFAATFPPVASSRRPTCPSTTGPRSASVVRWKRRQGRKATRSPPSRPANAHRADGRI